ncbi:MAG TPA: hypothetical protein VK809_08855 [Bacteroidia bacterium]|nr:hypothetical protein [Bacteroidia bacterium]
MTKKNGINVQVNSPSLKLIIEVSWDFAHHHLWKDSPFDKGIVSISKLYIGKYYGGIPSLDFKDLANARLKIFCDRIMLAKKNVHRFPYSPFPNPALWFDINNPFGYRLTKKWYEHGRVIDGKPILKYIPPSTGVIPIMTDEENFYSHTA